MIKLKDAHRGETVWIIGKGMSLLQLKTDTIGPGPVIAIYEAIVPVEALNIPNPTYCLEKDGGWRKKFPGGMPDGGISPECAYRECDFCEGMIRPQRATLLLHEKEAKYCFPDYAPRIVFNLEDIGMDHNEFSMVCAIKIGELMGCTKFKFVSFDAHANDDYRNVMQMFNDSHYRWTYGMQKSILPPYLEGKDYEWVTPG
jgi:hypothetical protein